MKFDFSVRHCLCLAGVALLTALGCEDGGVKVSGSVDPLVTAPSEGRLTGFRQFEFEYAADIQDLNIAFFDGLKADFYRCILTFIQSWKPALKS